MHGPVHVFVVVVMTACVCVHRVYVVWRGCMFVCTVTVVTVAVAVSVCVDVADGGQGDVCVRERGGGGNSVSWW